MTQPPKTPFTFHIAMDVRAYGTVVVTSPSLEAAQAQLTPEFVAENFSPHGSGSDDLDYTHPSDIVVSEAYDHEYECIDDFEEISIPDGPWIISAS